MAAAYVERLRDLLARTITALPSGVTVDIRHFFSGAATSQSSVAAEAAAGAADPGHGPGRRRR